MSYGWSRGYLFIKRGPRDPFCTRSGTNSRARGNVSLRFGALIRTQPGRRVPEADDTAFSTVCATGGFDQICGFWVYLKGRLGIFNLNFAGRVALSAAHSAVFEPLTYHTTPATIQYPACRAAPTCTTRTANLVKAARRQSAFTWVFRMPHSKACVYKHPLTM